MEEESLISEDLHKRNVCFHEAEAKLQLKLNIVCRIECYYYEDPSHKYIVGI